MLIAAVYYMIGVLLHNSSVKERAVNEFGQAIGVAIMVVIIVLVLGLLGNLFTSMFSQTTANSICTTLKGSYLGLTLNDVNSNGAPAANSITTEICTLAGSASQTNDFTTKIDYGLSSAYLIIANLTNQSADNLQGFYMFESYVGFLSSFEVVDGVCTPWLCGITGAMPRQYSVLISYTPLKGYQLIKIISPTLESQANMIFEFYVLQLLFIALSMYAWPILLAGGILLRATYFGRRAGGLLMAIAIGMVIFLPMVILLEYGAFSGSSSSPIGATNLPVLVINETQPGTSTTTVYASNTLDMYVLPKTSWIANHYGCWPNGNGNLGMGEADFAAWYLIPFYGEIYFILGGLTFFVSTLPTMPPGNGCTYPQVMTAIFNMMNAYGVMSVTGFILPFFNILIFFSGVRGLSVLFGGDTNLMGISKLI
jgi:hypothetical protein